jgi:hypothetical protein
MSRAENFHRGDAFRKGKIALHDNRAPKQNGKKNPQKPPESNQHGAKEQIKSGPSAE